MSKGKTSMANKSEQLEQVVSSPGVRTIRLLQNKYAMDNGANPKLKAGNNNQSPIQQALNKGLDNVVEILLK